MHIDLLEVRLDEKIQSHRRRRARGRRGRARRQGGRRARAGHPRAQHRGAAHGHPRAHRRRRVRHGDRRHDAPLRDHRRPPASTFLDDLEETIIATIIGPDRGEEPEIEEETELVGEEGAAAEAEEAGGEGAGGDEARLPPRAAATSPEPLPPSPRAVRAAGSTGSSSGSAIRATATRGTRHNVGFEVANDAAPRAGSCRRREEEVRRPLHRGPRGHRRPAGGACCCPRPT